MKDFRPSLAYFLIVLGQLCLNSEVEINLNLNVDISLQMSILNSRLADPYQLPEYSRWHLQTKQREHIALLF